MSLTRTTVRQDRQINPSENYNDNLATGSTLQTNSQNIQDDLNALRTMVKAITGENNWYISPANTIKDLNNHELFNTLTHNISENCYLAINRTQNKLSSVIFWNAPTMDFKIREFLINRTNSKVSQIVAKQYDDVGVLLITLTKTLNRDSSGRVISVNYVEV